MENKEVQRWMLVIRAIVCPMESMDPKYLLLVEQSDGRTWRMATGKDLLLVDRAEPRFFSALRDGYYEPRYCGCEPDDCDCEPEDCDFETDPRPGPPISSEPILRHLAMLATIPAWPNGKTTRQIHEEIREQEEPGFDVCASSIQRGLERLSRWFPIVAERRGNANYWTWIEPDALTHVPAMSTITAFVLSLASGYLRPLMPSAALSKLGRYFRHAETVLDGAGLKYWTDKIAIIAQGPPLTPPSISPDVLEAVCEALTRAHRVEVQYCGTPEREAKRILLNPLGIVVRTGIVSLVATCWKNKDIRHYALHRMSEPRMSCKCVWAPPGFRLTDHLGTDYSFAYPASDENLALRVLFNAGVGAHLTESRLSEDHRATELEDGRVLVEATVADTAQLRWWLAGFGSLVEVLGPESLRAEFREEARKLGMNYG